MTLYSRGQKQTMDITPRNLKQRTVGRAAALGAAAVLVAGATWHGMAAEPARSAETPAVAQAQTSTVSRGAAIAGGRDSYADVVSEPGRGSVFTVTLPTA